MLIHRKSFFQSQLKKDRHKDGLEYTHEKTRRSAKEKEFLIFICFGRFQTY